MKKPAKRHTTNYSNRFSSKVDLQDASASLSVRKYIIIDEVSTVHKFASAVPGKFNHHGFLPSMLAKLVD